jgi:hypothetical protein
MSHVIDIAIVTIVVLVACVYLGRILWRRYFRKPPPKKSHRATLTLGGKPIR